MRQRFGWQFDAQVPNQHVSDEEWAVSPVLLRQIAEDNAVDLVFHGHARELFASRQRVAPTADNSFFSWSEARTE
jgi:hypothetical protein